MVVSHCGFKAQPLIGVISLDKNVAECTHGSGRVIVENERLLLFSGGQSRMCELCESVTVKKRQAKAKHPHVLCGWYIAGLVMSSLTSYDHVTPGCTLVRKTDINITMGFEPHLSDLIL